MERSKETGNKDGQQRGGWIFFFFFFDGVKKLNLAIMQKQVEKHSPESFGKKLEDGITQLGWSERKNVK